VAGSPGITASLGGHDITSSFSKQDNGHYIGLVTGLALGNNVLTSGGSSVTLVNYPNSGPVFAGPQLQPWQCQQGAVDAQCNQPASYEYVYKSTDTSKSGFQPYDPKNPPSDVASTTTDQGVTVPFIVRIETGYQDRDQYKIAALFQPDQPWTAAAPQKQFNHKMVITHGVSCGVDYETGGAPSVTSFNPGRRYRCGSSGGRGRQHRVRARRRLHHHVDRTRLFGPQLHTWPCRPSR